MKPRPRSVEREIAKYLSRIFTHAGLDPVERIPVLGRTGPDLSHNQLGWIIDVKSRKSNPRFLKKRIPIISGTLLGVPLSGLLTLDSSTPLKLRSSKMLNDYYAHMDAWTRTQGNLPSGAISCIILHWPGARIAGSMLFTEVNNRDKLEILSKG